MRNMLNIFPVLLGLIIQQVFQKGSIYLQDKGFDIMEGVCPANSVCLQIDSPPVALVPHSIINGYKRILPAFVCETDYTFPLSVNIKAFLADASVLVAAALVAAPAADRAWAKAGAKEEPEEWEEDTGLGF